MSRTYVGNRSLTSCPTTPGLKTSIIKPKDKRGHRRGLKQRPASYEASLGVSGVSGLPMIPFPCPPGTRDGWASWSGRPRKRRFCSSLWGFEQHYIYSRHVCITHTCIHQYPPPPTHTHLSSICKSAFSVGCNSSFMRLVGHLTALRAWCKHSPPGL